MSWNGVRTFCTSTQASVATSFERARAYSYLVGRSVLLEPQFDVSKFSRDRQRLLNASTADGQLSDRHINTDLKNRLRDIETDCRNCFHV
jgi:hypothetical protein